MRWPQGAAASAAEDTRKHKTFQTKRGEHPYLHPVLRDDQAMANAMQMQMSESCVKSSQTDTVRTQLWPHRHLGILPAQPHLRLPSDTPYLL